MSQENQSFLRFSLEESVWFQKGQEVADLLSISLDPIITIQENDQYVTLLGSLELKGEYKRSESEVQEEEAFTTPKVIQSVMERDDGIYEFLHQFPVDITIPVNRIRSLVEIDVEVESFDYVFPERSCMNLSADLIITGLQGEVVTAPFIEEFEEVEFDFQPVKRNSEEEKELEDELQFEVEALNRTSNEAAEDNMELQVVDLTLDESELISVDTNSKEEDEFQPPERFPTEGVVGDEQQEVVGKTFINDFNSEQEEIDVEKQASSNEGQVDLFTPFEAEARKEPVFDELSNVNPLLPKNNIEEPIIQTLVENKVPEISFLAKRNEKVQEELEAVDLMEEEKVEVEEEVKVELEENESSSSSSEQEIKKKKKSLKSKKKNSLTLTEFFARKEEETHAKLKVCIVQHGDTLDKLSERYDVGVQHLLKVNQIEISQDIYEGQVLYIPVTVVQK